MTTQTTESPGDLAEPFLRGLRIAVVVIGAAVLIPSGLLRHLDLYRPLWVQLAAYGVLALIVVIEVVLVRLRRSWGAWRWPALALVLSASTASLLSIPAASATSAANWAFGAVGWSLLILLFDRSLALIAGFLLLHGVLVVAVVLVWNTPAPGVGLNLLTGSIGALGFPLACGVAVTALRAVSAQAERAATRAQEIRTAETVAEGLHVDRRRRLADLYDSTVPLLQGLADGSLDAEDAAVQRSCAIEAARMRRLFAETDDADDPLLHELRHGAEIAERRGVLVELATSGRWIQPPVAVRRALTDAPLAALTTAASHARVTVTGSTTLLTVGVVADCGPLEHDRLDSGDIETTIYTAHDPAEDRTWVEARWTPPQSAPSSSTTMSPSATA